MAASRCRRKQRWCVQPLTPLMEGPELEMQQQGSKKESSWEVIREWFRMQRNVEGPGPGPVRGSINGGFSLSVPSIYGSITPAKKQDLRLLLGVLGCPLAPIPLPICPLLHLRPNKDIPMVSRPNDSVGLQIVINITHTHV